METTLNPMQRFVAWAKSTDFTTLETCCDQHKQALKGIVQQALTTGATAKQINFARDIVVGRASHKANVTVDPAGNVSLRCLHRALVDNEDGSKSWQRCNTRFEGTRIEMSEWKSLCPAHRPKKASKPAAKRTTKKSS